MTPFDSECIAFTTAHLEALFQPDVPIFDPVNAQFDVAKGVFVTLKKKGHLRGCIGTMTPQVPLREQLPKMVRSAAFHDPRFPSLTADELPDITLSITILEPLVPFNSHTFTIGRHGLWVENDRTSGVLLPQVAVEYNWDLSTFLTHTYQKAGLSDSEISDARIYMFEAIEIE